MKTTIVVAIATIFFVIVGGLTAIQQSANADVKSDAIASESAVAGVSEFAVFDEGQLTQAHFSLIDTEGFQAVADAHVKLTVNIGDTSIEKYSEEFDVKASDFQEFQRQFTGEPLTAFYWQIKDAPIGNGLSYDNAYLTVTLPNGEVFTADDLVF
jgi:hypothetical protein